MTETAYNGDVMPPDNEHLPKIDGVPIDQIIKIGEEGRYMRAEAVSERELKARRPWTAFVGFDKDPEDGRYMAIEEIDIMATDETDARTITELALTWHYDSGGTIINLNEWPRGVNFVGFF